MESESENEVKEKDRLRDRVILQLYKDSPNSQKLQVAKCIMSNIPVTDFLNSSLVVTNLKLYICQHLDNVFNNDSRILVKKDQDLLKYLIINGEYTFNELTMFCDYGYIEDLCRYRHPSEWTRYCIIDNQMVILSKYDNDPRAKEFNFQRDIVESKFPISKLKRKWPSCRIPTTYDIIEWYCY